MIFHVEVEVEERRRARAAVHGRGAADAGRPRQLLGGAGTASRRTCRGRGGAPGRPRPRRPAARSRAAPRRRARPDRAQRPVLVRLGQEVQEVPRRLAPQPPPADSMHILHPHVAMPAGDEGRPSGERRPERGMSDEHSRADGARAERRRSGGRAGSHPVSARRAARFGLRARVGQARRGRSGRTRRRRRP